MLGEKLSLSIEVERDGTVLLPEETGFLGSSFPIGSVLSMKATVPKDIFAFHADKKGNISWKRILFEDDSKRIFLMKTRVMADLLGVSCTLYEQNNMRLTMWGERLSLWEIAIVAQDGHFFLTNQHVYDVGVFVAEDGRVTCPFFERKTRFWPQLVMEIRTIYGNYRNALPALSTYREEPGPNTDELSKNEGVVCWWSMRQNFGLIATGRGSATVHFSELPKECGDKPRLRFLEKGARVSYDSLEPARNGLRARRVRVID